MIYEGKKLTFKDVVDNFEYFLFYTFKTTARWKNVKTFDLYPHQKLIARKLNEITHENEKNGTSATVFVQQPPQTAKTTTMCAFIAWLHLRRPYLKILYTSASTEFATDKFDTEIKPIYQSRPFEALIPYTDHKAPFLSKFLTDEEREINSNKTRLTSKKLTTLQDGSVVARALTRATGQVADVLLLDDYCTGFEQASSPSQMKKLNKEVAASVTSRLNPGTIFIVLCTKWARDDPMGVLINAYTELNLPYSHFCFRAYAVKDQEFPYDPRKKGEILGEGFRMKFNLAKIQDPVSFDLLYQQLDASFENGYVNAEGIPRYDRRTFGDMQEIHIAVDTSFNDVKGSDKVCLAVFGKRHSRHFLLDCVYKRMSLDETNQELLGLVRQYNPNSILVETKANGHNVIKYLRKHNFIGVVPIVPKDNKLSRFQAVVKVLNCGHFIFPAGEFQEEFEQVCSFNGRKGATDDFVDCLTMYLHRYAGVLNITVNENNLRMTPMKLGNKNKPIDLSEINKAIQRIPQVLKPQNPFM